MKAWLNLRHAVPERWAAFSRGLERLGYTVIEGVTARPGDSDILVTWNRIREGQTAALAFEGRGRPVLVAENASWGNEFAGARWYTLARGFHNTSGAFPVDGVDRWDRLGVELAPWRAGGEVVLLPSRGIGPPQVAMPGNWEAKALKNAPGARVRRHPGTGRAISLADDLAHCSTVLTWGSGAAILAAMWGIRVIASQPGWIGAHGWMDEERLAMFRRLAWAQWRLVEIASGEPFKRLLA